MQLTPRYGTEAVLSLTSPPSSIAAPAARQRRRLVSTLAAFTDEEWQHPSRCAGWSSRDVIVHLHSTNVFWSMSIAAGLAGSPTEFLTTFDPVASPARHVADNGALSDSEVFEQFARSTDTFVAAVEAIDEQGWQRLAEGPPGHISISAVVHHALWDSWVHERDVLLPLGAPVVEAPDEVAACLRYAAALGPALAVTRGDTRVGVMAIDTTDPTDAFVVETGERVVVREPGDTGSAPNFHLAGKAVELVEAFSLRAPLRQSIAPKWLWMLGGLATTFDAQPV